MESSLARSTAAAGAGDSPAGRPRAAAARVTVGVMAGLVVGVGRAFADGGVGLALAAGVDGRDLRLAMLAGEAGVAGPDAASPEGFVAGWRAAPPREVISAEACRASVVTSLLMKYPRWALSTW